MTDTIFKALSGFYYVEAEGETVRCKARGRFRREKISPLVGDRVTISDAGDGTGIIDEILPRKNCFIRPPVANIDQIIIVASAAIPITAPFLIDRIAAIAEINDCEPIICVNKIDLKAGDELRDIYSSAGFKTIMLCATDGTGIDELGEVMRGKISAMTGNSGVGKSSILNALGGYDIQVGEVSEKLGRGRHTTRHVELYKLRSGGVVADTPGFSAFDPEAMELNDAEKLQYAFRDFAPYIGKCRYTGCTHTKEAGCAVLEALRAGEISESRHSSYLRLYEQAKKFKKWESKSSDM